MEQLQFVWDVAAFGRLWWKEQHQHFPCSAPLFCECLKASVQASRESVVELSWAL